MLLDVDHLPTIVTERLQLRWLTADDVPALFSVFGDPEVCRYWSRPALPNVEAAADLQREIVQLFAERSLFQWGIAETSTNRIVGTCTLAGLSNEHHRAEIGFALARSAWGRGYMAEAIEALLTFGFEKLQLHRIEADVDPRNHRSIAVLERFGFQREGFMRERYFLNGEVQDAVFYGLLRTEFTRRNVRPAREADIDALADIWYQGWQDAHAGILPAELARERTLQSFKHRLRDALPDVRVAERSGSPAGFCMIKGDELYQLYVSAAARGSGVAAGLVADAEARLRQNGVAVAWLACAIGNDRAARFYEKCGWRRVGNMINQAETSSGTFALETWRYEKELARSVS